MPGAKQSVPTSQEAHEEILKAVVQLAKRASQTEHHTYSVSAASALAALLATRTVEAILLPSRM